MKKIPLTVCLLSGGILCLFFASTLLWLKISWAQSLYYGHAPMVLLSGLLCAIMVFKRTENLPPNYTTNSQLQFLSLLTGIVFLMIGHHWNINSLTAWSLILFLWFIALFLRNLKQIKSFEIFLQFFACVVPLPFLTSILGYLQQSAIYFSVHFVNMIGMAAHASGSWVKLSNGEELIVAESCSGINSILVLFPLSLLASCLFAWTSRTKWILAALSLPLAWMSNILRVSLVLIVGTVKDVPTAVNVWHFISNALITGVSLSVITLMGLVMNKHFLKKSKKIIIFAVLFLSPLIHTRAATHSGIIHFTDVNPYYSTSHQGKWITKSDLIYKNNMARLPKILGNWTGKDWTINDPLPLFLRLYENTQSRRGIFIQPVYGAEESTFHTAEVCYINDGWKLKKREYKTLLINNKELPVRYVTAQVEDTQHLILYWYVWPNAKRTVTDGALMIRLSVEVINQDELAAEKEAVNFIEELSNASFGAQKPPRGEFPKANLESWLSALKSAGSSTENLSSSIKIKAEKNLAWLHHQLVPNAIVRRPAYSRRNLILSYELDSSHPDYKYTFSKSALYDNALAVIAFALNDEPQKAARIIDALERLLNQENDLYFSFNTHNNWPNDSDRYGAVIRSGASAWVGYSICVYIAKGLMNDPQLYQHDPESLRYLDFAETIAKGLIKRQITDKSDARYGLLTGGNGRYVLKLDNNKVVEEFEEGEVPWTSVEHNIDSYYFLRDLGRLTGNQDWSNKSLLIKNALLREAWNSDKAQFNRGVHQLKSDPVQALDCASWGSLFLNSVKEPEKATLANLTLEKYRTEDNGAIGYKPYEEGPVYENRLIQKHFYPQKGAGDWATLNLVWPEGTAGAGLAYLKNGDRSKAKEILLNLLNLQQKNGGIPYASQEIPFEFSTAPSVASNAWASILTRSLEDPIANILFWGP